MSTEKDATTHVIQERLQKEVNICSQNEHGGCYAKKEKNILGLMTQIQA